MTPLLKGPSLKDFLGSAPLTENDRRRNEYNAQFDRQYEQRARNELDANGVNLRQVATNNLLAKGTHIFQLQRVEVTGAFAGPHDDTDDKYWQFFGGTRIALSYFLDQRPQAGWARKFYDGVKDLLTARRDRSGELSERARKQLSQISNISVNELFAHSWGTDAVYAAILEGTIRPPRKLILMGLPSRNLAKWYALAHATGTDITIYGYDQDSWMRIRDIAPFGTFGFSNMPGQVTNDEQVLATTWNAWCVSHGSPCAWDNRPGDVSVMWKVPASAINSHLRSEYYNYFIGLGQIVPLQAMVDEQERLLRNEEQRIVNTKAREIRQRDPPPPSPYSNDAPAAQSVREPAPIAQPVRETTPAGNISPLPTNNPCHTECHEEEQCDVTYERRCTSGVCFDFPRQSCSPQQVCITVCD